MYRAYFSLVIILALSGCFANRTPITPGVVPEQYELTATDAAEGGQVMEQLTQEYQASHNTADIKKVRQIVNRLSATTGGPDNAWNIIILQDDKDKSILESINSIIRVKPEETIDLYINTDLIASFHD